MIEVVRTKHYVMRAQEQDHTIYRVLEAVGPMADDQTKWLMRGPNGGEYVLPVSDAMLLVPKQYLPEVSIFIYAMERDTRWAVKNAWETNRDEMEKRIPGMVERLERLNIDV